MKRGIKSRFKPLATALHGAFSCLEFGRLGALDFLKTFLRSIGGAVVTLATFKRPFDAA